MNTLTTLPTAILSFAFTGVFGPHRKSLDYEPQRVVSVDAERQRALRAAQARLL